jgi:hypothetical protein
MPKKEKMEGYSDCDQKYCPARWIRLKLGSFDKFYERERRGDFLEPGAL